MFNEERDYSKFSWEDLGDVTVGRPNLGQSVPVLVYRLFQYTMRDVLITESDVATANDIFIKAGKLAGEHFCRNALNTDLEFNEFIAELQQNTRTDTIFILTAIVLNLLFYSVKIPNIDYFLIFLQILLELCDSIVIQSPKYHFF